jgi:uracil-DNA glycosylase family 4
MQKKEEENSRMEFKTLEQLKAHLHTEGCKRCDLGFQPNINGCCVARGPNSTNKMIIGEAPGKEEDSKRLPFTGPAGRLLDEIWKAAGIDTKDWYITNCVLCRPVAPYGSGKQNYTPRVEQRHRCRPYLDAQISLLRPRIIVAQGAVATAALIGATSVKMGDYRGKLVELPWPPGIYGLKFTTLLFPMIHAAAILHSSGTERYDLYRQQTWDDIRKLKQILEERNI